MSQCGAGRVKSSILVFHQQVFSVLLKMHCLCEPGLPAVVAVMERTERLLMDKTKIQPGALGAGVSLIVLL